ncbi:MAG: DNA-binding protein, partial [Actinomycetota bacterium]|nr:DNA-binding protein [Actinomycetota bacterium]
MGTERRTPRTLADVVRGWDDAALGVLLTDRPDLATPTPTDVTQLVSRACTRASVGRVLDRMDRFALAVVEALAALAEPVRPAEVAALVGAPSGDVDTVLGRLRDVALLWGPDDDLRLVRAVHEVVGPHPAGLGPRLASALAGHAPARLRQLADDLGIDSSGDKHKLCDRIGEHLGDAAFVDALVEAA